MSVRTQSVVRAIGSPSSSSKPLFWLLSLLLSLGLAACGGGGGGGDGADDGTDDGTNDDGTDDGTDGTDDGTDDGTTPDGGIEFEQVPLIEGLTTLAGVGIPAAQDGDRDHALFNNPVNLVITSDGDLIVADFGNSLIRRVTPAGVVSTISETPAEGMFVRPFGMALVGDTLYVETDGNSLGQPGPPGGALWSMPATGGAPVLVRDNIGRSRGLAALPDGRIAIADYQAHEISLFDPSSGGLAVLAGMHNTPGYLDAQGAGALFDEPYHIVVLPDDTLLVADLQNHCLRQVDLAGNVTTYAGAGGVPGHVEGPLATARFNLPQGLTMDAAGNLYVTDLGNYRVRRISPEGEVSTIAGNGTAGYLDDADPLAGQLFGLEGVDVGADGYLYIADGTRGDDKTNPPYHRIRRLTLE